MNVDAKSSYLAVAPSCCSAFDTKSWALRRLTDTCHDLAPQVGTQGLAQPNCCGALALTQRCGGHSTYHHCMHARQCIHDAALVRSMNKCDVELSDMSRVMHLVVVYVMLTIISVWCICVLLDDIQLDLHHSASHLCGFIREYSCSTEQPDMSMPWLAMAILAGIPLEEQLKTHLSFRGTVQVVLIGAKPSCLCNLRYVQRRR